MRTSYGSRVARRAARGLHLAAAVALLAASTACNSLLTVDNPARVPAESLDDPALMPILEAAAIQQFQCGITIFAATGGMLSGEYLSANGFVNNHPWEWRGLAEIKSEPGTCNVARASTFMGFYQPLQLARYQLDDTANRLEALTDPQVPNRARFLLEMRAYGGYSYLLLGEGMCQMTIDNGPAMTKDEVWAIAEDRFTTAIALAGSSTDATIVSLKNMAIVGRARVRLDRGNLTGAAADAALVPTGFVRNAEFSEGTPVRENRIYNLTVRNDFLSAGPDYRGLTVGTQADPRVKVTNTGRIGSDNVTPVWQQQKFITGAGGVPFPIASWNEAQLILAEAVGGQAGIDALNRVRAANGVTTPLVNPGGDITALVIEERRRQLFSEGQRYVDMLRNNIPFPNSPTGANRKGQTYGPVTCVPLPDVETRNNPNFKT